MADLVTHLCTALLPGALLPAPWRRLVPVLAFGTVLPDLGGRAIPLGLEALYRLGLPVPEPLLWPWAALHEPSGWALVSALCATAWVESQRWRVLCALWLGCALHTGLDLLQDHHGEGYLLLAPFSTRDFELGLIGSEATVDRAGLLGIVTLCAWAPRGLEWLLGGPPSLSQPWLWLLLGALLLLALTAWAPLPAYGSWAAACVAGFAAGSAPWFRERPGLFLALGLLALGGVLLR